MLKKIGVKSIAKTLYENKDREVSIDFYGGYHSVMMCGLYEYKVSVVKFADAYMAIANYYGGGQPFCYDFTDDDNYEYLAHELEKYLCKNVIGDNGEVWVNTYHVVTEMEFTLKT